MVLAHLVLCWNATHPNDTLTSKLIVNLSLKPFNWVIIYYKIKLYRNTEAYD